MPNSARRACSHTGVMWVAPVAPALSLDRRAGGHATGAATPRAGQEPTAPHRLHSATWRTSGWVGLALLEHLR